MSAILDIKGLKKQFGGLTALSGIDVSIEEGEILGIVGPNGSGKTTLFNVITGVHKPTEGKVSWRGRDMPRLAFPVLSAWENVLIACEHARRSARPYPWATPSALLDFVGLLPLAGETAGVLPFGSLRLLGIALALATRPSLILLDEPAAGLNDKETATLVGLVQQFPTHGISVCVIDHDMKLMQMLCKRLIVLDFGSKIADGPTEAVLADPKVLEVYLGGAL